MALEIKNLSISLAERVLARDFNLRIADGEIVCLMGPSASGKSSILAWVAGLLSAEFLECAQVAGTIELDGSDISAVPAHRRRIGLLFQYHLLFPHWNVLDNLLFALPPKSSAQVAHEALAIAGLSAATKQMPHTLSGGQQARVALLRSLLAEPRALLLDEPFSKLDAELRRDFRDYVFTTLRARNIPTLLVSHDISDAPEGARVLSMNTAI